MQTMTGSSFKDAGVFVMFAPVILPIALCLGLRGHPWTYENVRREIARFTSYYIEGLDR